MVPTSAADGPIPPAKKDDSEDVSWALSTAEAMFARGDRGDALKWLRRAAEAASEAQADDRALELAKAAADLASALGPRASARPPTPIATSTPPPPAVAASSRPAPVVPAPARESSPPPTARAPEPSRAVSQAPAARAPAAPLRARTGAPPPEVTPQVPPVVMARTLSEPPKGRVPPPPPTPRMPLPADDIDRWTTQTLVSDDLADSPDEKTRIGVPAYQATPELTLEMPAAVAAHAADPALKPAQAVRVVVWRAADGVHVAPQGTRVSAISVDAILVALDPSADLSAWLSGK